MASYEIQWKHSAEKELRGIDRQFISRIITAVDSLADDPYPVNTENFRALNQAFVSASGTIGSFIKWILKIRLSSFITYVTEKIYIVSSINNEQIIG
jgi:hypothetical protein